MTGLILPGIYRWKLTLWLLIGILATAGCTSARANPVDSQSLSHGSAAAVNPSPDNLPTIQASSTSGSAQAPELKNSPTVDPLSTMSSGDGYPTDGPKPTQAPTLSPADWQQWPVTPSVSQRAIDIYRQGLAMGTNPKAFSKIGDCQNITNYFLGIFDDPKKYNLGGYADLQPTIDQFQGSFSRNSLAVKGGFNVAAVLNPIYADPSVCNKNETPLACEIRLNRPSIVIISMETWWAKRPASTYENYLHQIVDYAIAHGALPILATKADNLEGDGSINASIAKVASDDGLPLWNFWRAVQLLPYHGLTPEDPDHFHITGLEAQNNFSDPKMMLNAWPVRNLTALQALDAVWHAVSTQ